MCAFVRERETEIDILFRLESVRKREGEDSDRKRETEREGSRSKIQRIIITRDDWLLI